MSDDERSLDGKKTWKGAIPDDARCMNCRRLLRAPIYLFEVFGNLCRACRRVIDNCLSRGETITVMYPSAGDSSSQAIISDRLDVFEPDAMNTHRNIEPDPSTRQQNIVHSASSFCNCLACRKERAAIPPALEAVITSEDDRSESTPRQVECVAEVHRANDEDETLETVTSGELTTTSEPCRFEEVVDITNSVAAETAEPAATVYSDDRHEPPATDKRLVPQDSSSSNETTEPTETTTVETPEDYSQDQRSQQSEVLPVENNTEQSNSEVGDVTDAVRIVNAPECSVRVREVPPHKKAEESEGLVREDNIPKEMPTESSGRDVPEGPVRPSVYKSDESEDSVNKRRMAREEKSLDVEPKPEDERREGKMTAIEKFGAEGMKLESSDDKLVEEDEKSHDHRVSEKPESSKIEEEKSASAQKKSESKKYDAEKVTTEREKDESLADEESEEESEDGSSEEESSDSEELKDKPDIPSNQKEEKPESKGASADDLSGGEESEEESYEDNKRSKTKVDDVESHRKESIPEEKRVDREEVVSTKEKKSSMKSPEVKDSSEEEKSDDEDECKDQEASTSHTERYARREEPKVSERKYKPLQEEDTSESEGSDSRKKKEESERKPKNVKSPKKQQVCAKKTTTKYGRLTESETEDEESNGNVKKEVREQKEAEKISAKEEGRPSQHKAFVEKASERGTSEANGKAEDVSKTSAEQKVDEEDQQESSSTRDKEQISCKKSPEKSKDLAEKEESSDVTEARDTVLMIVETNSPPRKSPTMEKRTLHFIENVALANIMKVFKFQCKNHILGCKEAFSPEEMVAHEETCLFQTAHCEFKDCIWTGTLKNYTRHFLRHTDLKKLQTVDDRFDLPNWDTQDSKYILQTSGGSFILSMRILEDKLYYLIYDLRRTVRNAKFDLFMEYYSKSGAKFKFRCNITRNVKLNYFDERKATAIDLNTLNTYIPLKDKPRMSIYVESEDPCFRMRATLTNLLKCKKCGLYMDSPIRQCMYGHFVCGSCYQNVKECPKCDTPLIIQEALNKWKDDAKYVCKLDLGKKVDSNLTLYHESSLCTFHPWTCPKCPESKLNPLFDYFDLIDHMQAFHRIPVLQNSESIKKISQLSYEIYFIQFSKLFLFKSVYLKETDTSEFYVIYIGPKQDRYRYEIQIKYRKGFYTKYMSLSCECAYNKSSEILRQEPQEVEQTTPVNAMSPTEMYISPDSSDLLSKEVVSRQISGTQTSTGESRYMTSQTYSNSESQTPTSTRLPYAKSPSPAEMVKQNTNQKITMRSSQEFQRRNIGNTVQASPTPADTPGITESPHMTSAVIPKTMSPELSTNIESKCLVAEGKSENDGVKLKPDEGIVIHNGLERFGERFEFDVKITKITA